MYTKPNLRRITIDTKDSLIKPRKELNINLGMLFENSKDELFELMIQINSMTEINSPLNMRLKD